jgi:hypothetical protein
MLSLRNNIPQRDAVEDTAHHRHFPRVDYFVCDLTIIFGLIAQELLNAYSFCPVFYN